MTAEGSSTLTLAIDASNPSMWPAMSDGMLVGGEVALGEVSVEGYTLLAAEPITQQSPRDDALASTIDRLLKQQAVRPSQLDRIAVSAGPGGFTSVRIAMITAKAMAETISAGVVVVPTAEAIARNTRRAHGTTGPLAVLLSGKRDTSWCAIYPEAPWASPRWPSPEVADVVDAEQFARLAGAEEIAALIADEHAPEGFMRWAESNRVEVIQPACSAEMVLAASADCAASDPADALPVYPREPEAVTKWRERSPR